MQRLRPEKSRPCSRTHREVMAKQLPSDSYFPVFTASKYLRLEGQGSDSIQPGTILSPHPHPHPLTHPAPCGTGDLVPWRYPGSWGLALILPVSLCALRQSATYSERPPTRPSLRMEL